MRRDGSLELDHQSVVASERVTCIIFWGPGKSAFQSSFDRMKNQTESEQ